MTKYPSKREFKQFFRRLPRWTIALILILLFGRFVFVAVWQAIHG